MKLYKFRALRDGNDLETLKNIIASGEFWCSNFLELNDPMEGVYKKVFSGPIKDFFVDKLGYKICSFCEKRTDPRLWGYYANGYRGVAIEIEIGNLAPPFYKVDYVLKKNLVTAKDNVIKILTNKLNKWKHEHEYRFLDMLDKEGLHKIKEVTGVYFGEPYSGFGNRQQIFEHSEKLRKYDKLKTELLCFCKRIEIPCYYHDSKTLVKKLPDCPFQSILPNPLK